MNKLKLSKGISCVYGNRCGNYNKLCSSCRLNSKNNFGNHLELKDSDGKTIKYLEKNINGN